MLSNSEMVMDSKFRVWIKGQGHDYHVVLTPVSILLQPTESDPDHLDPPLCCICPPMRSCKGCRRCGPCGPKQLEILGRDIVSCYPANHQNQGKLDYNVTGYPIFMIVAYPSNKSGKRQRTQMHFHLMQNSGTSDLDDATFSDKETKRLGKERIMMMNAAKIRDTWVHAITTSLFTDDAARNADYSNTQRRLLVIINPYSGRKKAQKVATKSLLPMLHEAGVDYEVLMTQYPGHAQQVIRQDASARWRGIVTVSGDGIVYEVLNGLFDRPDWREAMECLPLGIVPGGSGNGLARSIIHLQKEIFNLKSQVLSCSVNVAKADVKPLDLMYVETPYMAKVCSLFVGWGILADLDIESEVIRFIGDLRFTIWGLWRIVKRKLYRARISYIPISNDEVDLGVDNEVFEEEERRLDTQNIIEELHKSKEDLDASSDDDADANVENLDDVPSEGEKSRRESEKSQPAVELIENQSTQPPGTYLVPRHVSYGTMLAQGQLYFRSWQELQSRVMSRPGPENYPLHEPSPVIPTPQKSPLAPPPMPPPCPKHGYKQMPIYLQQQATANSSMYSTAAAALKR